jgi:hypothetical protein
MYHFVILGKSWRLPCFQCHCCCLHPRIL